MKSKKTENEETKRIQYDLYRMGAWTAPSYIYREFAIAIEEMEKMGLTPIEEDGRPAGNLALRVADGLVVTRSFRNPGPLKPEDLVKVLSFDHKKWQAKYASYSEEQYPSSDTPLHWAALVEAPYAFRWITRPRVLLHGHSIKSEEDAEKYQIPISRRSTEASTPEDVKALADLFKRYPYPGNRLYIRRDHGFFVLGPAILETLRFSVDYFHLGQNENHLGA